MNDRMKHKTLILASMMVLVFIFVGKVQAQEAKPKTNHTGLYKDVFDDNIFNELTSYLRFDRLFSAITFSQNRSKNVNVFDEVADNTFFVNRHAKTPLSLAELEKGYRENEGLASGSIKVTKGKFEGLNPGFFVKDSSGDKYLLKFDYIDSFELRTAAEIIASRLYHAIGYNVPQYTVEFIAPEDLSVEPGAETYDDSGFKKELTEDKLQEYLLFLPQDVQGNYRVSASKLVSGEKVGYFTFHGRRGDVESDKVNHRDRREVRALRVFSSWINNYDTRDSNTLTMYLPAEGKLKNYLIDFGSSLGGGSAVPMFTFEHMLDYGEAMKAFFSLGFWEKPWQKRWREAGMQMNQSPAVGDFDNKGFKPDKFKTQLPYYAFKDLTLADAFWAAKIIMSFSDEEIHQVVKAGKYSDPNDATYVAKVLIERRDLIGRHWFSKTSPLDRFDIPANSLQFEDLGVKYGFSTAEETTYLVDFMSANGKRLDQQEIRSSEINLASWMQSGDLAKLSIRVKRGSNHPLPRVDVHVQNGRILGIRHQD